MTSHTNFAFDMGAYQYDEGLKAIRLMYNAALTTLDSQYADVINQKSAYYKHLQQGGEPIEELDEEGYVIWDQDGLYRLELLAIDEAKSELRRATALALYHHWEKTLNRKKGRGDLAAFADEKSLPRSDDIECLRHVANYIKHGGNEKISILAQDYPDMFGPTPQYRDDDPLWVNRLYLDDDHISRFFDIVGESKRAIIK